MSNKTKICVECGKEHRRMGRFCRPCYNASRPVRPCSVEGCDKNAHPELSICEMHRTRKVRHGTLESSNYRPGTPYATRKPPRVRRPIPEDRFEAAVDRESAAPCWLWTANCNDVGYATFLVDGKKVYVHRWIHEREIGPIPDGHHVDHVYDRGCRHRNCVNPAHLEAVTPAENQRRMVAAQEARKRTSEPYYETQWQVGRYPSAAASSQLGRPCPTCGANADRPCRTTQAQITSTHKARFATEAEWQAERARRGKTPTHRHGQPWRDETRGDA